MTRPKSTLLIGFLLLSGGCGPAQRVGSPQAPERLLTVYPVDRPMGGPDTVTSRKLAALAAAVQEITDSTRRLPDSIDAILELRREVANVNPRREWTIDGWGRPILFSRHQDHRSLLLLSRGADGEVGGGDDLFAIVWAPPRR